MAESGSEEWFAEEDERMKTEFTCKLRTLQALPVPSTVRAVVERMLDAPGISKLIEVHEYTAVHFREKQLRFRGPQNFIAMLPRLANEPRALIGMGDDALTFGCQLLLNCTNTLVNERVAGKRRQVPEKSEFSEIQFDFSGPTYCVSDFLDPFLRLVGDCFEIIGGDYGWVRNRWLNLWTNNFDDCYGDRFAPQFLTWANVFGPRHAEAIGRSRFRSARAHRCVDLPGGGILLTLCADPRDFTSPNVQKTVKRIKKHLGILSPSERATPEELAAFEASLHREIPAGVSPFAEAFRRADEETPGEMARQAQGTVEGVKEFWLFTLDYTAESVDIIDELILVAFPIEQQEEDSTDTAVQAFGAYLGECVRRNYGGTWRDENMKGQPVLLDVGANQKRLDPFAAVRQRFEKRANGASLLDWWNSIST